MPQAASTITNYYSDLKVRAAEVIQRYQGLTPQSASLAGRARGVMPGGSTRLAVARKPYAPFVTRGEGAVLQDVDGRTLVDFWFNATALPLGHSDPRVVAAVTEQVRKGSSFFAPTEADVVLAEELHHRVRSCERVLFTNSGTEAVLTALRIARAATGRAKIAKFEGSYHGFYDDVMWSVAPGPGLGGPATRPEPTPSTAGLPGAAGRAIVLPYNDLPATEAILASEGADLAAVIVEPIANRIGLVVPERTFMLGLRDLCTRLGVALVFDEVLAFRLGYGGAQGWLGIEPDLTTFGKIIGGGLPVGAVGGAATLMSVADAERRGPVPSYGTFSANPMTMVAGQATLAALTPTVFDSLNADGERLRASLRRVCQGLPLQVTGAGSLFKVTASAEPVTDYRSARGADLTWQELASLELLNQGFLLTTQLHGCLSTATTSAQLDAFVDAFARVVGRA